MKPIGDGVVHKYTNGKCYRFAAALWIEHGKKHRLVIFYDEEYGHACLEIRRGQYLDVTGLHRGTRKTLREFGFRYVAFVDDPHTDINWRATMRRKGWKEDVRKAQWLIRRNRARYLLDMA